MEQFVRQLLQKWLWGSWVFVLLMEDAGARENGGSTRSCQG